MRLAPLPLLLLVATSAQAAIVGDSVSGDEASNYSEETREGSGETLTFGAVLSRTPDVAIDQIQFNLRPTTGMDVTKYILETELGGASGSVTWLPDGDGTILIRQTTTKNTNAAAGPTDYFLVSDPSKSNSQGNQGQNKSLLGPAGSSKAGWDPENGAGSFDSIQGVPGTIHSPTNPLGPGDIAFGPQSPPATLDPASLPEPSYSFLNESGAEGEYGDSAAYPPISQAALETEHLPEPSTLTMFGLASLGLAFGALRRALRKAA